jgi:hypothetical protein
MQLCSVTVAGDHQVRVFDAEDAVSQSSNETEYVTREACTRVLRCHTDRCKRIVTEDSPDLFLTVSEVCTIHSIWEMFMIFTHFSYRMGVFGSMT